MSFADQLPNGWSLQSLEEITSFLRRGKSPDYAEAVSDFPIINQKCIGWGEIDLEHLKFHSGNGLPSEEFFLRDEDILLNSTGTGTIGRVAKFSGDATNRKYLSDSHVTVVRVDAEKAVHGLVSALLSCEQGQRYLEAFCFTGSTNQLELSGRYLRRLKLPLSADIEEQKRITQTIGLVESAVFQTQASINAAQKLKRGLMQNLLTGKLKPDGTWRRDDEFEIDPKFGRTPKGWAWLQIRTFGEIVTGCTPRLRMNLTTQKPAIHS